MTAEDPQRWEAYVTAAGGWRAEVMRTVRRVVTGAVPGVVEEWKWAKPTNPGGVPVWSVPRPGPGTALCTVEVYARAVKLTFFAGAALPDPTGLFTSSLTGRVRRAVDLTEGQQVDERALAALFRAAAARSATTSS